jgi:hypothetical protein
MRQMSRTEAAEPRNIFIRKCVFQKNQETHHRKKTFREEYIGMLKKSRIDFDEKYLFD